MGGRLSNAIDLETEVAIHSKIEEMLKVFNAEIMKSYTVAVVHFLQQDAEPIESLEDEVQLLVAPLQSAPLKCGVLFKRGEVFTSWKNRYFIIRNESLNYQIEYYKGISEDPLTLKGIISPVGYRVYEFNSQEIVEHGGKGLKLVPINTRRRTWLFRIPDDAARKSWLSMLEFACFRATAELPTLPEGSSISPLYLNYAFNTTMQKVRSRFYCWWGYSGVGHPQERLAEFVFQMVEKDILIDYFQKRFSEGTLRRAGLIEKIYRSVEQTVENAAATTWTAILSGLERTAAHIENSVNQLIDPLLEKRKELKVLMEEKVMNILEPFLVLKGNTVLRPVNVLLYPYIIQIFMRGIIGFHEYIFNEIPKKDFSVLDPSQLLVQIYDAMNDWHGPNRSAYQTFETMNQDVFPKIVSLLSGGVTPSTLHNLILDKFRRTLHRAAFTFITWSQSAETLHISIVITQLLGIFLRDIPFMIKSTLLTVLQTILAHSLQELVIKPSEGIFLSECQEMLESIPVPGLSLLIDLPHLLQETVQDITDQYLMNAIENGSEEITIALDKTSSIIGVAYEGDSLGRSVWRTSVDLE